ncbi:NADPH:quinone oxidoreductase family protein [Celeribacter sp.]|uniref:NADPH:quinone oxidoreductase family protein n=1 Tax=Celeribacter sp. TaxID=1890673 RepID=UPI003A93D329
MSKTTTAYRIAAFDQPPAMETVPLPQPARGEVQLRVRACGLNFADLLMCKGQYQDTPTPPFTLGMELAGEVEALGAGVSGLHVGQSVAVFSGKGGLATHGNFPADRCTALPRAIPHDVAAALQITYGTSHMALAHKARLQPGERLVVTGAAGGVGLTAVEIGKLMGAEVIAIARGENKRAVVKAAGADHVIDAEDDDIRDQIKALGGADVVYDVVGGALFDACFRATNPDGRMMLIGFAGGDLPALRPNHMLVKNITVIGFYWGGYFTIDPAALRASLEQVFDWAAQGRISPHISHRMPFERAGDGLQLLKDRKATGKVVVTM